MKKKIPKGWMDYTPYGEKVEGTQILPFKTPLMLEALRHKIPEEKWFTPALLMGNCPQLKAIIDLTDTDSQANRYYNPQDFIEVNVDHLKIRITGGGLVPRMNILQKFFDAVDGFVKKFSNDPDALIGVHCTHGLNRTGYLICKYLVLRMGCEPGDAIARFQRARGYEMYRQNFIEDIMMPGRFTDRNQRPDYRRHTNTVRPVEQHHIKRDNWRARDAPDLSKSSWQSVHRGHRNFRHSRPPPYPIRQSRPAPIPPFHSGVPSNPFHDQGPPPIPPLISRASYNAFCDSGPPPIPPVHSGVPYNAFCDSEPPPIPPVHSGAPYNPFHHSGPPPNPPFHRILPQANASQFDRGMQYRSPLYDDYEEQTHRRNENYSSNFYGNRY